jgi:hypothetical protein
MYWTRRKSGPAKEKGLSAVAASALGLAVALGAAGGCKTPPPGPAETYEPKQLDEAMAYRQEWPQTKAYFASGAVRTYRSRWPYTYYSAQNNSRYASMLLDFPAFVYQSLRLPFTYLFYPPFSTKVEPGLQVNPSFTGVPPLRADPGGYRMVGGTAAAGSGAAGAGAGVTGGADGAGSTGTGGTGAGGTDAGAPGSAGQSERSPTAAPGGAGSGGTGIGGTGTGGTGTGSGTGGGTGGPR